MRKVGVLISGSGSNLQALLDASKTSLGEAAAYEIVAVISNNVDAFGLERARAAGVDALAIDHRVFGKNREAFERTINAALKARGVEIVALAGFMRVLTPFFVGAWSGRMINIHPSLLPKYPGLHTHARAIEAGDVEAGCTVHLVTEGVDEGPVLGQARVPILAGDTADDLAARILVEEHKLYPDCLSAFAKSLAGER
jgi:formyltetrahydrofolate-dependent phosphoribosylglycinamide formyltransferase